MSKVGLFGRYAHNDFLTAGLLACLESQGIRKIGELQGAIVVEDTRGGWWTLADNGGEINVEKVNRPETLVSVPTVSSVVLGPTLTLETVATRVYAVVMGGSIDWGFHVETGRKLWKPPSEDEQRTIFRPNW